MTQHTEAAFGEVFLADRRAALAGARVQARIGHDLIDPTEAGEVTQFGAEGGRCLGANAGDALQMLAVCVVAQHLLDRRLQLSDLLVQMEHLPDEGADDQAPGGDSARTGGRAACRLVQQGDLCSSSPPVTGPLDDAEHGVHRGPGRAPLRPGTPPAGATRSAPPDPLRQATVLGAARTRGKRTTSSSCRRTSRCAARAPWITRLMNTPYYIA